MLQFKAAGYWKPRKEDLDACTARLQRFLLTLSECDPVFEKWYRKGMSGKSALRTEIDLTTKENFVNMFDLGRHLRDSDKSVIDELGFQIGVWNGKKSIKMVGLSVTCGQYASTEGLGGNNIMLELPEDLGGLKSYDQMLKVLSAVVDCWEPDWAGVYSVEATDSREFNTSIPFIDWMVFLSARKWVCASVPEVLPRRTDDSQGTILVLESEPPQPGDIAHIERVHQIERAIRSV
jgi:hypothetical protein